MDYTQICDPATCTVYWEGPATIFCFKAATMKLYGHLCEAEHRHMSPLQNNAVNMLANMLRTQQTLCLVRYNLLRKCLQLLPLSVFGDELEVSTLLHL